MTDHSPEPRDPWAPPEQPAVDLGKRQGAAGPVVPPAPAAPAAPTPAPVPPPPPASGPAPASPFAPPPAYGHPAQGDPGGYAYPGPAAPDRPANAAYPGYPGGPGYAPYAGAPGYPGYPGFPAYPRPSNGFGITALVLGIVSLVACFTLVGAVALGIGAVVFGALGRGKANRGEADNGGLALAGIICGSVGIALGAALMLLFVFGPDRGPGDDDYVGPPSDTHVNEKI